MKVNSDYRDLLQSLNEVHVRYLVVGGYAWMAHTEPRYTKDLDIWVDPVESNARLLLDALQRFGAPTKAVTIADFTEQEVFYQIGVEPVRIDIMTSVAGLTFSEAWERRVTVDFEGVQAQSYPGQTSRQPKPHPIVSETEEIYPRLGAGGAEAPHFASLYRSY